MLAGILLALLTSVSWSLGNVFIQRSGRAVGAPRAMLWALAIGGVLSGAASLGLDRRVAPITGAVLAWTAVAAVAGLCAYACLFYAFARARLSLATPFVSSWSLFAGALSFVAFGERARPVQLAGALAVLAGVLFVSFGASREVDPGRPGGGQARPLLAAFGSGVAFGIMVPAMAHVSPALGAFGTASAVYALGLVLAVGLAVAGGVSLKVPPRSAWPVLVATGLTETLGFVSLNFARRFAPIALVAPVASLSTALTVLYAYLVLREKPHPLAAVGAAIASAGLILLAL